MLKLSTQAVGVVGAALLLLPNRRYASASSTEIPVRALGTQGLKVPVIGLGCMGMSAFYISKEDAIAKESEHVKVIQEGLKLGVTHLDTAELYGPHLNEILVGKAVAGNRDKYTIATKFGIYFGEQGPKLDSSPANVRRACEDSLKRLGTDYIDLYYQHRPDPNTPIEDTMKELKKLVQEGKIKYIGLSETSAENIRKAHAVHPISALQYEWSIWTRDLEKEIVPVARELGIGIVAYSPLGRGFLAGGVPNVDSLDEKDWRRNNPRFKILDKNAKIAEKVKQIAAKLGVTPAQVCLAWVLGQGEDVVVIPGTTKLSRLQENIESVKVKLSAEDLAELEDLAKETEGSRY